MRVVFRQEASAEAREAKDWYEASVQGLGFEFVRALEVAVQSAVRMPEAFPLIDGECRRVLMRRFPYSVVYRARRDTLLVVAVFHHSREPGSWLGRVGG
jgi:toxin ParE1/3/4